MGILNFRILLTAFLCLFVSQTISAQNRSTVTGRIVNSKNEGVSSASVSVKGIPVGAFTDEQGYFEMTNVPAGRTTFVVSGVGVEQKETVHTVAAGRENTLPDIVVNDQVAIDQVYVVHKGARIYEEQPFAVSVVDLSKAYNTSASLAKLLGRVSSVRVREDGGVGSGTRFSINGFSGNQVKMFMDGLPIDNFGSSFGLGDLPANMASRMEVYKGVLPANLGMDALGGAVNIVTRKDANYLDASYSIGSFNTHKASLNGAYTSRSGFTVRANAYYNYSDNDYRVYAPILDLETSQYVDTAWVRRFHDNYRSAGVKLESGVVNKKYADLLLFGILYSDNDTEVQNGQTMQVAYGGITRSSRSIVPSLRYAKENLFTEGFSLSFYGAYNDVEDHRTDTLARKYNWLGEWVSASSATSGENSRTQAKTHLREWLTTTNLQYEVNDHHLFTLNHSFSTLERKTYDKEDRENTLNRIPQSLDKNIVNAGYTARYDRWNLTAFGKMYHLYNFSSREIDKGTEKARIESVSRRKNHFGYGGAATFFPIPSVQLKASYERAYRLPQSGEIFGDGLFTRDNPDLKPEKSDNINVGLSWGVNLRGDHRFELESGFIYRNTTDYILRELSQSGNSNTTKNTNRGKVRTLGVEGGVRYWWRNRFVLGANITYQDITDQEEMLDLSGSFTGGWTENPNYKQRISNIPYLFSSLDAGLRFQNVIWDHTELSVDYAMDYVQEYFLANSALGSRDTKKIIPEQLSHDISVGYKFGGGHYNITLECRNFTDRKLYDNYMLQKPGRSFSLKLRYFFKYNTNK